MTRVLNGLEVSQLRFLRDALIALLAVMVLVSSFREQSGRIMGYLFPVVRNVEISEPVSVGPGVSQITGSFSIVRPQCDFQSLDWYLTSPDGRRAPVAVEFLEGVIVRPGGDNEFGPWQLNIPASAVLTASLVEVRHSCPFLPFDVITSFYP